METIQFYIRLGLITLWLIILGLAFTAIQHWGSLSQLGWPTLLFYGFGGAVLLKTALLITKHGWSFK